MRSWLLQERLKAGLTQKQMGERIGVTEAYYSYIEKGERQQKMDIPMCMKLAEALNIPVPQIIENELAPGDDSVPQKVSKILDKEEP